MQQHRRCSCSSGKTPEDLATCGGEESTGVGGEGGEPIGDSLGAGERSPFSASMATDVAVVEEGLATP